MAHSNNHNFLGFDLPDELIAHYPSDRRDESQILLGSSLDQQQFPAIIEALQPGDLLVLNDTRVQPVRLAGHKADTGGKVELLVIEQLPSNCARTLYKSSHRLRLGQEILCSGMKVVVKEVLASNQVIAHLEGCWDDLMENHGQVPLPPYLKRQSEDCDKERYQSVWAKENGSSAAPTASLHFTPEILEQLHSRGVQIAFCTLHVGLGTFLPLRTDDLDSHVMHKEWFCVPGSTLQQAARTQAAGRHVVAVGTTVMRALESVPAGATETVQGFTELFIRPGFEFHWVDRLLTNFHQPDSTLLLLVQAFAGTETIRRCYAHAVAAQMRLYSYGDCVLLDKECHEHVPA